VTTTVIHLAVQGLFPWLMTSFGKYEVNSGIYAMFLQSIR
jgi:hypothetical protein